MGFLDKLRGKKDQIQKEVVKDEPAPSEKQTTAGRKIKRYTSEGKPVYD
jgi:hypothetical protein